MMLLNIIPKRDIYLYCLTEFYLWFAGNNNNIKVGSRFQVLLVPNTREKYVNKIPLCVVDCLTTEWLC